MEVFDTFFWATLGICAGISAPGILTILAGALIAAIASAVTKND